MNCSYNDIRDLIAVPPRWWDERAVPRWCEFSPHEVANIYADEVVFLLIACQSCGREFEVAHSLSQMGRFNPTTKKFDPKLAEHEIGEFYWGDPPNIGCCAAGPTMSSETRRVLEFWERDSFEWVRRPDLEGEIAGWGR